MNNQEYEQKKRKCWEEFCQHIVDEEEAFYNMFDRAYTLGKQTETISQKEIEKAAEKFADEIRIPASIPGVMVPFINGIAHDSYLQGAQDYLGKQEKDTEKKPSLTDKEVYALESSISELESLIEGALDEDYRKEQKSIISALKRIIKKYEKK